MLGGDRLPSARAPDHLDLHGGRIVGAAADTVKAAGQRGPGSGQVGSVLDVDALDGRGKGGEQALELHQLHQVALDLELSAHVRRGSVQLVPHQGGRGAVVLDQGGLGVGELAHGHLGLPVFDPEVELGLLGCGHDLLDLHDLALGLLLERIVRVEGVRHGPGPLLGEELDGHWSSFLVGSGCNLPGGKYLPPAPRGSIRAGAAADPAPASLTGAEPVPERHHVLPGPHPPTGQLRQRLGEGATLHVRGHAALVPAHQLGGLCHAHELRQDLDEDHRRPGLPRDRRHQRQGGLVYVANALPGVPAGDLDRVSLRHGAPPAVMLLPHPERHRHVDGIIRRVGMGSSRRLGNQPQVLGGPVPGPPQGDVVRIGRGGVWARAQVDQPLHLKAAVPEEADPLAIRELELDRLLVLLAPHPEPGRVEAGVDPFGLWGPAHEQERAGDGEREPAPGPEDPGHLGHGPLGVGEPHGAVIGQHEVEGAIAEGELLGAAVDQGDRRGGLARVAQLFAGEIDPDRVTIPLFEQGAVVRTFDTPEFRGMTFYEVHARSIINRVPDASYVPFRWSINPYRGCSHACDYCMVGDTPILMANGRTKPIADVRVGDQICGTVRWGTYRHYAKTMVLAHWSTIKQAYRIKLEDGTELVASADHRFLTNRGWKHVTGTERGADTRPHLTTNNKLMRTGRDQ